MAAPIGDEEIDVFKDNFKKYKKKKPPPDLSEVIDFRDNKLNQVCHKVLSTTCCDHNMIGLKSSDQWQVFELQNIPGFSFIINPFLPGYQRYWVKRCAADFSRKPNLTNLDMHMKLDKECDLWQNYCRGCDEDLMEKLRWVTLGYHHDWNTKEYSEDNKSPFPEDLASLSQHVATCLGYCDFQAEAAIINYYHMGSTLAGHTDHSERDHEAPLISFSFGQSAIFLLGGITKDIKPVAMYIHSGDIIVMANKARLCYHAIPRITPSPSGLLDQCFNLLLGVSCTQCGKLKSEDISVDKLSKRLKLQDSNNKKEVCDISPVLISDSSKAECSAEHPCLEAAVIEKHCSCHGDNIRTLDSLDWTHYKKYLRCSRINMNVRQVLKPGHASLT